MSDLGYDDLNLWMTVVSGCTFLQARMFCPRGKSGIPTFGDGFGQFLSIGCLHSHLESNQMQCLKPVIKPEMKLSMSMLTAWQQPANELFVMWN
jgi:hypothetical protein